MAETLTEKDLAKEKLEQYLATHKIKIAHTARELYGHSVKDDDGEEVDEFMRMRDEWRGEDSDSHREID